MAQSKDWFNSPDWTPAARDLFEKKLARARNKGEYLRTKGVALLQAGDTERRSAGRELLERALHNHADSLMTAAWAHESLGYAYAVDGMHEQAEECYRAALDQYARQPSIRGRAHLRLAELIIATKQDRKYKEAGHLLDSFQPLLKSEVFDDLTARARLSAACGAIDEAAEYAQAALKVEAEKEPQLTRHPDVGLIEPDEDRLRELSHLASRTSDQETK